MATRDGDILDSDDDGRTWRPLTGFEGMRWESFFATVSFLAAE